MIIEMHIFFFVTVECAVMSFGFQIQDDNWHGTCVDIHNSTLALSCLGSGER